MYRLSRRLPDGSCRPVSAGMTARDEDTVACEVLPGEEVAITFDQPSGPLGPRTVLDVALDAHGQLVLDPSHLTTLVLDVLDAKPLKLGVCERGDPRWVGFVTYNLFDPGDVRLFVQVFPLKAVPEPVPVV